MHCNVRQRFHAVGHGTFLTGLAVGDGGSAVEATFAWAYDCGSRSRRAMADALIVATEEEHWPEAIDMLILSHFDDDHVNGLEDFLLLHRTKYLVLPYSEWHRRLRDLAFGASHGVSASTAALQIDPIAWLESRGLSARVEAIILVQGNAADPDDVADEQTPVVANPVQDRPEPSTLRPDELPTVEPEDVGFIGGSDATRLPRVHLASHRTAFKAGRLPLELMFYNAEMPGPDLTVIDKDAQGRHVARKSGVLLEDVRREVEDTFVALGLDADVLEWPHDWRQSLKACYGKHFGTTAAARNNISLCLLVLPFGRNVWSYAPYFFGHKAYDQQMVDRAQPVWPGLLCTGDLHLDETVLDDMRAHFGPERWQHLGVTQVPHHGSASSWETGNADKLSFSMFVHCAPCTAAHPHPDVIADLAMHRVLVANYKYSVTLDYRFEYPF